MFHLRKGIGGMAASVRSQCRSHGGGTGIEETQSSDSPAGAGGVVSIKPSCCVAGFAVDAIFRPLDSRNGVPVE